MVKPVDAASAPNRRQRREAFGRARVSGAAQQSPAMPIQDGPR